MQATEAAASCSSEITGGNTKDPIPVVKDVRALLAAQRHCRPALWGALSRLSPARSPAVDLYQARQQGNCSRKSCSLSLTLCEMFATR